MLRQVLKGSGLAAVAVYALATVAQAAPVLGTSSTYYEAGAEIGTNSNGDSPSSFTSIYGGKSSGSAYSSADGILNVSARTGDTGAASMMAFAFPVPSGAESVLSVATWEDTITNTHGRQIDYKFIFHVANPRLQTTGAAGDYAGLSLDILMNGVSVWSAFAEIDGASLDYSANFGTLGLHIDTTAYFASFDAAVDLGTIAGGQSFTLTYIMQAYTNAANPPGDEDYLFAAVGDPFSFEGNPFQIITTDVPSTDVPAPAGLALLGLALVGLGLAQRRRYA